MKSHRPAAALLALAVPLTIAAVLVGRADAAPKVKVRFVTKPPAASNSKDVTMRFGRNTKFGIKAQVCKLDGGSWTPCFRAFVVKNLADGKHTAYVKLEMKDGRHASDSYTWQVDTVAPQMPVVNGGSAQWSKATGMMIEHGPSTDASPSTGVSYQRRISYDGGTTWAVLAGPGNTLVKTEGDVRVQYRAVDGAGNASDWSEAIVRLDRTKPTMPSASGASALWQSLPSEVVVNEKDATDSLSGVAAAGYQAQTRTGPASTWSRPSANAAAVTVKRQGVTEVRFRAVDNAGNIGDWSAPQDVKLDRSAPTAPSVSGGGPWVNTDVAVVNNADASDSISAVDPAGYEYQTSTDDGATWSAAQVDDTGSVIVSAEGTTLVRFRSHDLAGNPSDWTNVAPGGPGSARIDLTAPSEPTVTGGGSAWSNSAVTITNSADSTDSASQVDPTAYQFQTSSDNGASWSAPQADATHDVPVTGEGITLVRFRSHDNAGNASSWTEPVIDGTGSAKVDTTAPQVPTVTGTTGWSSAGTVDASASSADTLGAADSSGVTSYTYKTSTDGGTTYQGPFPTTDASALAVTTEGVNDVVAKACDSAGNCSDWSPVATADRVRIDRTAPTAPTVSGGSTTWTKSASVTITDAADSTDSASQVDPAGYELQKSTDNGTTWSAVQTDSSHIVAVTAEGITLVRFRAHDNAGNTSPWTNPVANPAGSARIDRTAPAVPAISLNTPGLTAYGWTNQNATATASATDTLGASASSGMGSYAFATTNDGGATRGAATLVPAATPSYTVTTEGTTQLQGQACDAAGNCSAWSPVSAAPPVHIDKTPPPLPAIQSGGDGAVNSCMAPEPQSVTYAWASSGDALSGLAFTEAKVMIDGTSGAWQGTSAGTSLTWYGNQLGIRGQYHFQFRGVDRAGNVSPWTDINFWMSTICLRP
jgi:large repetitive protein